MIGTFNDYGLEFQEKFLQALITDQRFAEQMLDVFKSEYVEVKHLQFLSDRYFIYAKKYKVFPSLRLLVSIIKDDLRNNVDIILREKIVQFIKKIRDNPDPQDLPWIKEKSLDFCRKQALKEALEQSVDLIAVEKYESIVDVIKKAVMVGTAPSIGHNIKTDIDSRFERIVRDCIPTGIPQLDRKGILNGGVGKGELAVIIASTGSGKCIFEDARIHIRYNMPWNKVKLIEETVKIGDFFNSVGFLKISDPTDDDGDSSLDVSEFNFEVLSDHGYNKIEALRWTKEEEFVCLYFRIFENEDLQSLECSPDHIVMKATINEFTQEKECNNWIKVKDLRTGDLIVTSKGFARVEKIDNLNKKDRLCDIQVANCHSYYSNDVLSHNSHWLVQMGASAFSQGLNVVHYTMELYEPSVGIRYDSNLIEIDADEILSNKETVRQYYNDNKGKLGSLIIKEFPTNYASVFTLRSHLERLNVTGFIPDLVVVDYADVMRSTRKFESLRHELRQVYEDLRQLAGELKVPIWTACFDGETMIETPFGNHKIEDLVGKKNFPVYSYNHETDMIELKTVNNVYLSNSSAPVMKVTLDNGEFVIATPSHKFMKRDGTYVELKNLTIGDSLMPLRITKDKFGWQCIRQNDLSLSRVSDLVEKWRDDRIKKIDEQKLIDRIEKNKTIVQRTIQTKFGSKEERIQKHIQIALECKTRNEFTRRCSNIPLSTTDKVKIWNNNNNHKVVSIESLGTTAVYNMEVDELHNYALCAGIIVKNSQSNKEGANADIIDVTNMSEAYGKAMTADIIISVSRKSQEKSLGTGRLFVAKNRAGKDGLLFPVTINTAQSRFDLGSEMVSNTTTEEKEQKAKIKAKWSQVIKDGKLKVSSGHSEKENDEKGSPKE